MTQEHPIIPPPELVHQWHKEACKDPCNKSTFFESKTLKHIATQAARWGADQELEACCKWVAEATPWAGENWVAEKLRKHRRPKPPSLKEQALEALAEMAGCMSAGFVPMSRDLGTIRRAREKLDD